MPGPIADPAPTAVSSATSEMAPSHRFSLRSKRQDTMSSHTPPEHKVDPFERELVHFCGDVIERRIREQDRGERDGCISQHLAA